ncbi:MAG: xanthine dehydrogenase family protein molybdopterin-binding subunit [Planctomycetes bacterium]|nr:xanthine dehydrogenase family protein molybdopterin-binding subunit [Planctomycetota bacterium]
MPELKYIGRDAVRPDTPAKATGNTKYIHDIKVPGMLWGKIKFSDRAHAKIKRIDTSKAEALRGVRVVLTGYNTPRVNVGFLRDNCALKKGKVRQFRDEIAAVAAIDEETAQAAIDLIEVEYEDLPGVFDPREAMKEGAPLVHEFDARGKPLKSNVLPLVFAHHTGDLDAARKKSKYVRKDEYSTPLIQQACMGTAGCISEFDNHGNLTITAKTQIPFLAQRDYMRALEEMGLPGRNARVIIPALGGGFGTGLDTHVYEYISILLAHYAKKPVKILYDRFEEFAYLSPRQSTIVTVEQGLDESGLITFRKVDVLQDNGAYASWGATYPSVMLMPVTSLYRVPVVHFDSTIVYTNNTYAQAMRGYGNPEVTFPIESNLDDLAKEAGIDPLELRLRNVNMPGDVTPMKLKLGTCGLKECLVRARELLQGEGRSEQGAERSATVTEASCRDSQDRGRPRPHEGVRSAPLQPADGDSHLKRGVGYSSLIHVGGGGKIYRSDGSGIILKFDDFGNVYVSIGGVEMGQGLHSSLSLCVAEELGISPANVFINQTDTANCPWDVGTHASRGAFMACNAAILACSKAKKELAELAVGIYEQEVKGAIAKLRKKSPLPPGEGKGEGDSIPDFDFAGCADPENFELRDGGIRAKNAPAHEIYAIDLARFLRAAHFRDNAEMLTVSAFFEPANELPDWSKGEGNMSMNYAFGVQGARVEVDTETGEIKILKMASTHDVGKVLNYQTLIGQCMGGLAQGIGYAMYEEIKTKDGKILNPGFTDYKIPTSWEMNFPVEFDFIETNDPSGPYGAKGVGEPGLVPTPGAIANAVADAIGVRIHSLPITPEKVLKALKIKGLEAKKIDALYHS